MHYNEAVNHAKVAQSVEQENYRAVPTLRQASHCVGCKQCIPKCPQSIQIPRELRRIDAYVEKLKQDTLSSE